MSWNFKNEWRQIQPRKYDAVTTKGGKAEESYIGVFGDLEFLKFNASK